MSDITLSEEAKRFILHWGEMGTRWGVNRTVAQIHALLYLSERPLDAETIAGALSVARSNVSNSLKELQSWGLVKTVHVMGDRRDRFETSADVWEMFRTIVDERKRRELDPTLAVLRELAANRAARKPTYEQERMGDMLTFFEDVERLHGELSGGPGSTALKALKLEGKLRAWLGALDRQ